MARATDQQTSTIAAMTRIDGDMLVYLRMSRNLVEALIDVNHAWRYFFAFSASAIFFTNFAGSLLKSFKQDLQQSFTSRPSCVSTYGAPMSPSFSPDTTHVLSGYGFAGFFSSAAWPNTG